jgi:hypothetical protein
MADMNWTAEAVRYSVHISQTTARPPRGAVKHPDYSDVSVVFAPDAEIPRIEKGLSEAGVTVLGRGNSMCEAPDDYLVALLVRSAAVEMLLALVNATDKP